MDASILENVIKVSGVYGAAIADKDTRVMAHRLQPPYEPMLVSHVIARFKVATEAVSYVDTSPIQTAIASFDDGVIVTRLVGELSIVVIASHDANLAMLAVALNAMALKLADLASRTASAPGGGPSPTGDFSMSDSAGGASAPPDALPKALIKDLLRCFAQEMGPFAKVMLKEQLVALGVTASSVRRTQWPDLLAMLAAKVPDAAKRSAFLAAARGLGGAPR